MRRIPLALSAALVLTASGIRAQETCEGAYLPAFAAKACGYDLPKDSWDTQCGRGWKPEDILDKACRNAYQGSYGADFSPDGVEALDRARWGRLCDQHYTPYDILSAHCVKAYKPEYSAPYRLSADTWEKFCLECIMPKDILALHQQDCRQRYDDSHMRVGLSRADWQRLCDEGLGGKTPGSFLREKKVERGLNVPPAKLTLAEAQEFMKLTGDDKSPAVQEKRKELRTLLSRAKVNQEKFAKKVGKSDWNVMPLTVAGADSEASFQSLSTIWDLNRKLTNKVASVPILGQALIESLPLDERPVVLAQKKRGLDTALEDPRKVQLRLMDQVASMALLKDEKGAPLYDDRMVAIMREVVGSVPVRRGDPPHTDLVALEDARRTIDTMHRRHPVVEWDEEMSAYGSESLERNPDGSIKSIHIKLRSTEEGAPFSTEQIAGTFIHEVGGHGYLDSKEGGANMFVHETAWLPQFRYYHNKQQEYEEEIRSKESLLKRAVAGKDPGADPDTIRAEIADLTRRKEGMLDETKQERLTLFQQDPTAFRIMLVSAYYGPDEQFTPGEITLDQQLAAARLREQKAEGLLQSERGDRWFFQDWLDVKFEDEELAEEYVSLARREITQLKKDDSFYAETLKAADKWRTEKQRLCVDQLETDPEFRGYQRTHNRLMKKLGKTKGAAKKDALMRKIEQIEGFMDIVEARYAACSVR